MINLENEQVSKEITDKAIALAMQTVGKPTLDSLRKGLATVVKTPIKAGGKKIAHGVSQKIHPTEGKQSVKTLIKKGQGVTSIPLDDDGLKDFQRIAKKYGVDFAVVKDKSKDPPIYTLFFKARDTDAISKILDDCTARQLKKGKERPSVLEKLQKFKEKVAEIPKKVFEKKKVMER